MKHHYPDCDLGDKCNCDERDEAATQNLQPYQKEIVKFARSGSRLSLLVSHQRRKPLIVSNSETGGQVTCYL